ncbi:ROK family protein [Streptomyces sp. NPDC002809]|uniref:ROK family protein n=1 Tax=Streptomyces sp. NPDC002809 TaxID=3154433 RepID=UPI00333125AC
MSASGEIELSLAGEPCPCGATGCLEVIVSGPTITRHAPTHGWQPTLAEDAAARES